MESIRSFGHRSETDERSIIQASQFDVKCPNIPGFLFPALSNLAFCEVMGVEQFVAAVVF